MPYKNFTDFPLWKEASELADSVFDFSRSIEDFSLRNRMTASATEIPFLLGEAAQSDSDETMKNLLWKVEDPVNELRSVLTEAQEQGFAPDSDYAAMQERCRVLFQKVHMEASSPVRVVESSETAAPRQSDDPELPPVVEAEKPEPGPKLRLARPNPETHPSTDRRDPSPSRAPDLDDTDFDENAVI
jgi:four helix bundle protein